MDKQTSDYRKGQLNNLNTAHSDYYPPRLKIKKLNGETKWLDIDENELTQIVAILTKF